MACEVAHTVETNTGFDDLEPLLADGMDTSETCAAAAVKQEKAPRKSAAEMFDSLKKYMWTLGRTRSAYGPYFGCDSCNDYNYQSRSRVYFDGTYVWLQLRFCTGCAAGNIRQQLSHISDFPKRAWNAIKARILPGGSVQ